MQEMQDGSVLHVTRPWNHLRYLRDLRRDENRNIRKEQANEIIAFCLMLPEFITVHAF